MTRQDLAEFASLIHERNLVDERIAQIIGRPMTSGHAGEWIAAQIFDIELERSAVAKAIDGRFRTGPLAGRTVNVKWYLKREGLLDLTESALVDYYLVMTGPKSWAATSARTHRPWRIDAVYLFDAAQLLQEQMSRRVQIGVASSVTESQWRQAEIYPTPTCSALPLSQQQVTLLSLFNRSRLGA